jgi:DNA-binding GntR family transcriptional regulator
MQDIRSFPDLTEVADSHLPVLEALASGDACLAADRLETHMHRSLSAVVLG